MANACRPPRVCGFAATPLDRSITDLRERSTAPELRTAPARARRSEMTAPRIVKAKLALAHGRTAARPLQPRPIAQASFLDSAIGHAHVEAKAHRK